MHQSNGCLVIYYDWTVFLKFKMCWMDCLWLSLTFVFWLIIRTALRLSWIHENYTKLTKTFPLCLNFLENKHFPSSWKATWVYPLSTWVSAPVNPHRVIPHISEKSDSSACLIPHMIWWQCGMKWAFWDVDLNLSVTLERNVCWSM